MVEVKDSILDSTKKVLMISSDDPTFDLDIIMHINSVFSTLHQLGVGPKDGFEIEDRENTWAEFLGGNRIINSVKTLMYLQVRLWFDPPTTSYDLSAKKEQIQELQWRLNVAVDRFQPTVDGSTYSGGAFMWELEAPAVFPREAEEGDLGIYIPTKEVWRKH